MRVVKSIPYEEDNHMRSCYANNYLPAYFFNSLVKTQGTRHKVQGTSLEKGTRIKQQGSRPEFRSVQLTKAVRMPGLVPCILALLVPCKL